MNRPTSEQIANNFGLWGEYVDPDATMTREQFDAMTTDEKLSMMRECFGSEMDEREQISQAAAALGRIGGKAKSERKTNSSRENGKKGGRPKNVTTN